jgi:lysophospholipase L1-like esterase
VEPPATLTGFHAALARLGDGREPDAAVRVWMYGASGTAADLSTGYVRAYLQSRFGAAGTGFVPLGKLNRWSRHHEVEITVEGEVVGTHAMRKDAPSIGAYGLLGTHFTATAAGAAVTLAVKPTSQVGSVAAATLWYAQDPEGGTFRVTFGAVPAAPAGAPAAGDEPGGPQGDVAATVTQVVDTRGPPDVGSLRIVAPAAGAHALRVEAVGDGPVRWFGATLDTGRPGVELDTLGVDGAEVYAWRRWEPAAWEAIARARPPELFTVAYGTNEAVREPLDVPGFRAAFTTVLARLRAVAPEASCVVLLPVDFPVRVRDEQRRWAWQPRPALAELIAAEREVAQELGCGTWDGLAFMGGAGSMVQWVAAEPPLAREDHLHFTVRGAARKGQALAAAFLAGFGSPADPSDGAP